MAFMLANKSTLARDLWPEGISVLMGERSLSVETMPASRVVPLDEDNVASWVSVDVQPELSQALVYVRQESDAPTNEGLCEESVELLVRVQGVVAETNLSVGGDWDGTLPNAMRASQLLVLCGNGCDEPFEAQMRSLRTLRSVVLRALGKSIAADGGRERGTLCLRRRVFTKIRLGINDNAPSLVKKEEDPKGKFKDIERTWRITDRLTVAAHGANGDIRRIHPLAIRKGDMVDVAFRIVVAFRGGKRYDVFYEPSTIVRLADQQKVSRAFASYTASHKHSKSKTNLVQERKTLSIGFNICDQEGTESMEDVLDRVKCRAHSATSVFCSLLIHSSAALIFMMPEYSEIIASTLVVNRFLEGRRTSASKETVTELRLQAIYADATREESKEAALPSTHVSPAWRIRAAQDLVMELGPDSYHIARGTNGHQEYVWPRLQNGEPVSRSFMNQMVLYSAQSTPRTIVLSMGVMALQVRMHTHTMTQIFTRHQWDEEISIVAASVRGFRIGLGLDFGTHIIVFGTLDNIFTPYWTVQPAPLKVYHADVYSEWEEFLAFMASKVKEEGRRGFASTTLAIDWMRTNVGGVGVYMSEEIMHYAGIPSFLELGEFLRCPSRVARFCESFWTLAFRARTKLSVLMEPCFQGFVLAPTVEQRMRYADWLAIHAKKQVMVSKRWKRQWENFQITCFENRKAADHGRQHARGPSAGLLDPFEPTLIETAFRNKANLGHLIFGYEQWISMSAGEGMEFCAPSTATVDAMRQEYNRAEKTRLANQVICKGRQRFRPEEEVCCDMCDPGTVDCVERVMGVDPLTQAYAQLGMLLRAETNLEVETYVAKGALFLPNAETRRARVNIKYYQRDGRKAIWTTFDPYPDTLVAYLPNAKGSRRSAAFDQLEVTTGKQMKLTSFFSTKLVPTSVSISVEKTRPEMMIATERQDILRQVQNLNNWSNAKHAQGQWYASVSDRDASSFQHVVRNTNGVAIGPLEYCATAYIVSYGRGIKALVVCKESPAALPSAVNRVKVQHNRVSKGLHKNQGKAKKAKKHSASIGGWALKTESYDSSGSPMLNTETSHKTKRRLHADAKIALDGRPDFA